MLFNESWNKKPDDGIFSTGKALTNICQECLRQSWSFVRHKSVGIITSCSLFQFYFLYLMIFTDASCVMDFKFLIAKFVNLKIYQLVSSLQFMLWKCHNVTISWWLHYFSVSLFFPSRWKSLERHWIMQKQHYHLLSVEMQWNKAQWNLNPLIQCIQKQLNSSGRKGVGYSVCANMLIYIITYFLRYRKRWEVRSSQVGCNVYVLFVIDIKSGKHV